MYFLGSATSVFFSDHMYYAVPFCQIYGDLDESKPSVGSSSSAQNQSASTTATSADVKPKVGIRFVVSIQSHQDGR